MWFIARSHLQWITAIKEYKEDKMIRERESHRFTIIDYFHIYVIRLLLANSELRPFVMHATCVILGSFVSPVFYAIGLLVVINVSEQMQYVLKAVTSYLKQLIITLLLALLIFFIYANLLFYYFSDSFEKMEIRGGGSEEVCRSISQCFFTLVNYALRAGGGVGELMNYESYAIENRSTFYQVTAVQISFFLLINVIFLNMIYGIIIDAFGEMREEKEKKEHSAKNICLLCSLERWEFKKRGKSFDKHIKYDHNIWNYVYYIYDLSKKSRRDLNGQQTLIFSRIEANDISWLPIKASMELGKCFLVDDG
eukprot:TRINITY_DN3350_c0_g4_i2.p1 TRINITY_DN3350_c0_g4~~TRINITY_DN3350_c0_g4_i2.p1  ORF type:complete len:309 (+),score=78.70 TRINITY_DN3350_c0_g4_i2:147-1073(+)